MFCSRCGGKINDNSKWCPYCGQKVEISESSTNQQLENTTTKAAVFQPYFQAQQAVGGLQYNQQMPFYQGMQYTNAKPSLSKRGLWGVIGAILFLFSILSEFILERLFNLGSRGYLYYYRRPYIEMIIVAIVALLLVLFVSSKTVLLSALYYVYYYAILIYVYFDEYGVQRDINIILITGSLAILGLILLIINVFIDKRKQLL